MSIFMDTLKIRLADAQKRLADAARTLQVAQVQHQVVSQEVFGWQKAVEAEARKEAHDAAVAAVVARSQQTSIQPVAIAPAPSANPAVPSAPADQDKLEINKTDTIRDVLRQHATGMTPGDVWDVVKDQIGNRDYVYSVLKRLKDSGQALERRGKYYLRETVKIEEAQTGVE